VERSHTTDPTSTNELTAIRTSRKLVGGVQGRFEPVGCSDSVFVTVQHVEGEICIVRHADEGVNYATCVELLEDGQSLYEAESGGEADGGEAHGCVLGCGGWLVGGGWGMES